LDASELPRLPPGPASASRAAALMPLLLPARYLVSKSQKYSVTNRVANEECDQP
jgi:hypothetical protein